MIGVHFTEVDEFLDELDKHADDALLERRIVRATPTYRTGAAGVKTVGVLASFVSTRPPALPELIHVEAYAGQLWGNESADQETFERRDALMDAIRGACERHGLELRCGWYEATHR